MPRGLRHGDGYIDRNEFDFFVSRIRRRREVRRAVAAIADYRVLAPEEQETLHTEIRDRIPGVKKYSNWRDVGLHISQRRFMALPRFCSMRGRAAPRSERLAMFLIIEPFRWTCLLDTRARQAFRRTAIRASARGA